VESTNLYRVTIKYINTLKLSKKKLFAKMTVQPTSALLDITIDLVEITEGEEENIPLHIYDATKSEEDNFQTLYHMLQQKSRLKFRIPTLHIAYQMGEFLEDIVKSRIKRALYKSKMTTHFYQGSVRTYHIFKHDETQIFRTKVTTVQLIRSLRSHEWKSLIV